MSPAVEEEGRVTLQWPKVLWTGDEVGLEWKCKKPGGRLLPKYAASWARTGKEVHLSYQKEHM